VAGNKGSADLARDVRGFAVKLYTKEGNWDLVGNNIPVFFIQDAIKFPDVVHAAKQEPDRGFPQAQTAHDNFWDFISLTPESMHMIMWIMSDRTIPRSFRFMEGFGVHTFRLINRKGKSTFVKFHWKPKLGLQSVVWNEAVKINGADPDFHRRDLWTAIQMGDYPEWELGLQLFDEALC
jgi:catalase